MKAIVYHRYGGPNVVALAEVPKPTPRDNEVLIRIHATTVTTGDWRARSLDLPGGFGFLGRPVFGMFGPRQPILGTELAGVVEAIGKAVTRFKIGDEVFAFTGARMGCHAEYRAIAEDSLIALKPANLSFEQAAALSFGGTTALAFLTKGGVKQGDNVLIVGASGSVGTAAVQIATHLGANVTGVCRGANADLVRSLGASAVIDYSREDFALSGATYDVILDTTGTASIGRVEGSLKPGGRLLAVLGSFAQAIGAVRPSKGSRKKIIAEVAAVRPEDLQTLATLAEAGDFVPVIDRSYPLERAADAHAYVDTGRKRGNVVLSVA
jgi:NADPH:quinone reductase-like Zn-dependent oxidoreductase